jgi:uncharacterized protein YeaO (DUF488 family)
MIWLCSLQDIAKYKKQCDKVYTCTIWPKQDSPIENVLLFAPSSELVGGFYNWKSKMGDPKWRSYVPVDPEQFTNRYEAILDERMPAITKWCDKHADETVALCCYCAFDSVFCHLDALEIWFWKRFERSVRVERKH